MDRHLSRRQFLGVSAAAIVSAAAAACGATPTATPVPKPAAQATAAPPAAPTPAPAQKVKIAFANWWGAQRRPLMDKVIEEFMKVNPNIEVENQEQTWDNRDQLAATIMASSTPPAVVMSTRVETLKYAKQGLIIPITPYVQAAKLDVDKLFYPGEIANQRWNNELWTFPMPTGGGNSCLYLYDKTVFKNAGLDPDKPPATWQELETVCKAITKKKGTALETIGTNMSPTFTDFVYWLICNGGHFATEDAKKITVNSPEGVETLEWMVNFTNEINGGVAAVDDFFKGRTDGTVKDYPFHKGLMGVWWVNVSAFSHVKTNTPEKYADPKLWGCALRPYNSKNPKAKTRGETGLAFAWGQVIPKAVPKAQQDAAYKFIEFLSTNDKGVCYFLFSQDRPAPLKSCNDNPEYKKNNPYWDVVMKGLETDVSSPVTPVQAEITSLMNESVQKAFFGTLKPKAALDEAVSRTQPILDKYWSGG